MALADDYDLVGNNLGGRWADKFGGLVFDATGITTPDGLKALHEFFTPLLRNLGPSGRVVVVGTTPGPDGSVDERIAQRALEGFTRSLGKETAARRDGRRWCTCPPTPNPRATGARVDAALPAVGQVGLRRRPGVLRRRRRLDAARRLGPAAGRQGRHRHRRRPRHRRRRSPRCSPATAPASSPSTSPQAGEALAETAGKVGGTALTLDVTADDAVDADHRAPRASTTAARPTSWSTTPASPATSCWPTWTTPAGTRSSPSICLRRNVLPQGLVDNGTHRRGRPGHRPVVDGRHRRQPRPDQLCRHQGRHDRLTQALAPELAEKGVTINAVAPGFIETQMTEAIPLATREVGRRLNSLFQGGQPVDVAETIAYFASPASNAVTGNVIRVCGQAMLGA